MASYVTYKTIISKAISDFNAIQDALATVGATYNTAGIGTVSATGTVLVPTGDVGPVITGQLQLKADGTLSNPTVSSDGTIDVQISDYRSYRYVKLTLGSATTPTTTITPSDMTGVYDSTKGVYRVTLASKTQAVTPTVTAGWVTSGTAGNITVASKSLEISRLDSYIWSGASLKANGSGYVVSGQVLATMSNASISADSTKYITVTNALKLVTTDDTSKGGVNVYNDILTLTEDSTNASGYSNVSTTEPTSGNYIAFTAKSSGGSTTASTSVKSAGYAATNTYSTTVNTSGHSDVTYYYPVKSASATLSGSKAATTPTISNQTTAVSGKTRITNATFTTDASAIGKFYLAALATAPATTGIGLSATALTKGYLSAGSQISATASTTAKNSGVYYYSIPEAGFSVSGNTVTATAGYVAAGTVGTISAGSLAYNATFSASYTDVDGKGEWGTTSPTSIFVDSLTDAQKAKDYYTITATGSGTLSAGYISANPAAATKTVYMPKATLAYVTDSNKNKIIEVKTAGFLPAGVLHDIGEISGTLDIASLGINLGSTPTYNSTTGKFDLTATLAVNSAGYVDGSSTASATASIAKATYTGGGLSGATTSTLSVTSGSDYLSTSGKAVTIKASNHTITRAKTSVATAGYADLDNTTVLDAGSATITGGSTTVYIKSGTLSSNSGSNAINNLDSTATPANKGAAKVYSTAAKADANNYVTVSATATASASVSTSGWIDTQTKSTGNLTTTAYLKASVNPTVTYSSSASTSNLSATQFTNNTSSAAVSISGGTNKTVTSSAGINVPSVGDTYIVGTLQASQTAANSATISADCSGSNVDTAFQSLYNRMLGYQYTEVTAD